ncbi:hypothetical protein V1264_008450 [Littorina saxatilis]|uniref:Uncharacterized protein n=1 Tax=Littorina saxatilis TaxID=31220 RepID=A0AAN9AT43_9CAEN
MKLQTLFLTLTCLWLSGTGKAVPSPATRSSVWKTLLQPSPGHSASLPQPPEKSQPPDMFHPFQPLDILQTNNFDLAQKLLPVGLVSSIDGIPMEKLPRTFWKAAVLSAEIFGSRGGVGGLSILPAPPEKGEEEEGESMEQDDMGASAYCTTDECVQMMKEYEEWRAQNGYGTVGGRWG